MINLLPDTIKDFIKTEYRLRVIGVALGAAISVVWIAILLLVPSYILSFTKNRTAQATINDNVIIDQKNNQKELSDKVEHAKQIITVLKPESHGPMPSRLIKTIVNAKTSGITLSTMKYSYAAPTIKIDLSGIAADRQSLRSFTMSLQQTGAFEQIDLPVSNFAKDSNINFSFEVSVKQ